MAWLSASRYQAHRATGRCLRTPTTIATQALKPIALKIGPRIEHLGPEEVRNPYGPDQSRIQPPPITATRNTHRPEIDRSRAF